MVILNYLGEIWEYIPEFEEQYQASNFGRIKSLKFGKEIILKPSKHNNGYLYVVLYINCKPKTLRVHRLVWSAFHGEIPEGMQINHINEIKTDNRLENLELVTRKENCNWGTRTERAVKALTNHIKFSKPVLQYDLEGGFIKEWCSASEIERQTGFSQGNISSCCRGLYKTAYNYIWKYKNEDNCLPS